MGTGTGPDAAIPRPNSQGSEPVPIFPPRPAASWWAIRAKSRTGRAAILGRRAAATFGRRIARTDRRAHTRPASSRPTRNCGATAPLPGRRTLSGRDRGTLSRLAAAAGGGRFGIERRCWNTCKQLAATVACQIIPCRATRHDLPEQIRADAAHFAVCVDGDGETCRVLRRTGPHACQPNGCCCCWPRDARLPSCLERRDSTSRWSERLEATWDCRS